MKHHFKPPFGDSIAKIADECPVLVQRMNRPPSPEPFWNSITCPGSMERYHSERDRPPAAYVTISVFKLVGSGKKAGVIVANTKMHFRSRLNPIALVLCLSTWALAAIRYRSLGVHASTANLSRRLGGTS